MVGDERSPRPGPVLCGSRPWWISRQG